MLIKDYLGEKTLKHEFSCGLLDIEFEYLLRLTEKNTQINVYNYLSETLKPLETINIAKLIKCAELDVLHLEDICRRFYYNKKQKSIYAEEAENILNLLNYSFPDKELCITLGVIAVSIKYRIWSCKKTLFDINNNLYKEFGKSKLEDSLCEIHAYLKSLYTYPTLSKLYLHAFDLKLLSYYNKEFNNKTAFEYLRKHRQELCIKT